MLLNLFFKASLCHHYPLFTLLLQSQTSPTGPNDYYPLRSYKCNEDKDRDIKDTLLMQMAFAP